MDGSALLFILMPIVIIPLLVGWLAVIFYADSRLQHKIQSAASEVTSRNSAADPWSAPRPGPAYGRQSPDIADPGPATSLPGGAERPAA